MKARSKLIPHITDWEENTPTALIDRFDVAVGDWALLGDPLAVEHTLQSIGDVYATTREGEVVQVFRTPKIPAGAKTFSAEVGRGSAGNVTYRTVPVFGGTLANVFGSRRVQAQYRGEHLRLGLSGRFNLLRFITAQHFPTRTIRGRAYPIREFATAIEQCHMRRGNAICLTDDTNLLLGPAAMYDYARLTPLEDLVRDYMQVISSLLREAIDSISSDYGVRTIYRPYFSLQYMEFVWEFDHSDPVRYVEHAEAPMRAMGQTTARYRALVRGEEARTKQDSFIVKTELCSGCTLAVYAKTNHRVRFEVRLTDNRISTVLKAQGVEGRTTYSLEDLCAMVSHLRDWAAIQFRDAMAEMHRSIVRQAHSPIDLCLTVARTLGDDALTKSVLETLRHRGSLASPQHSPSLEAAKKLTKAGVLSRRAPRHRVFVPKEKWVSAVQGLRRL
jgi:hypothetical protein